MLVNATAQFTEPSLQGPFNIPKIYKRYAYSILFHGHGES